MIQKDFDFIIVLKVRLITTAKGLHQLMESALHEELCDSVIFNLVNFNEGSRRSCDNPFFIGHD